MPSNIEYLISIVRHDGQIQATPESMSRMILRVEQWLELGGYLDALRSPPLRVRDMEKMAKLPQREADDDTFFDLPDDFLEIRSIFSDTRPLADPQWIPYEVFRERRDFFNSSLTPVLTTSGNSILIMPIPEKLEILYYSRLPSLVRVGDGDNPSNFVFDRHRQIYEDGVVAAAAYSRRTPSLASPRFNSFEGAVQMANMQYGASAIAKQAITGRPINAPGERGRLRW